jgi:hypothetical protein
MIYQMVLHRPVELAGVIGNYDPLQSELAEKATLRELLSLRPCISLELRGTES